MREIFAFCLAVTTLLLGGCGRAVNDTANIDAQTQAQFDNYNRQTEQMDKILAQQETELERGTRHNDRYEKLLTKWEEQARRYDAVLTADEKRVGIKP